MTFFSHLHRHSKLSQTHHMAFLIDRLFNSLYNGISYFKQCNISHCPIDSSGVDKENGETMSAIVVERCYRKKGDGGMHRQTCQSKCQTFPSRSLDLLPRVFAIPHLLDAHFLAICWSTTTYKHAARFPSVPCQFLPIELGLCS